MIIALYAIYKETSYAIFDKELFLKYTNSLLKDIRYSSHLIIQEH